MSNFQGGGSYLRENFIYPFFRYRRLIGLGISIFTLQACLCYVFYGIGAFFSSEDFGDHIRGLYGILLGVALTALESSIDNPIRNVLVEFLPNLKNDLIKYSLYFLIGIPNIFEDASFQLRLGSTMLAILGVFGAFISFKYQGMMSSYISVAGFSLD